jgi:hypothetical protein
MKPKYIQILVIVMAFLLGVPHIANSGGNKKVQSQNSKPKIKPLDENTLRDVDLAIGLYITNSYLNVCRGYEQGLLTFKTWYLTQEKARASSEILKTIFSTIVGQSFSILFPEGGAIAEVFKSAATKTSEGAYALVNEKDMRDTELFLAAFEQETKKHLSTIQNMKGQLEESPKYKETIAQAREVFVRHLEQQQGQLRVIMELPPPVKEILGKLGIPEPRDSTAQVITLKVFYASTVKVNQCDSSAMIFFDDDALLSIWLAEAIRFLYPEDKKRYCGALNAGKSTMNPTVLFSDRSCDQYGNALSLTAEDREVRWHSNIKIDKRTTLSKTCNW